MTKTSIRTLLEALAEDGAVRGPCLSDESLAAFVETGWRDEHASTRHLENCDICWEKILALAPNSPEAEPVRVDDKRYPDLVYVLASPAETATLAKQLSITPERLANAIVEVRGSLRQLDPEIERRAYERLEQIASQRNPGAWQAWASHRERQGTIDDVPQWQNARPPLPKRLALAATATETPLDRELQATSPDSARARGISLHLREVYRNGSWVTEATLSTPSDARGFASLRWRIEFSAMDQLAFIQNELGLTAEELGLFRLFHISDEEAWAGFLDVLIPHRAGTLTRQKWRANLKGRVPGAFDAYEVEVEFGRGFKPTYS